MRPFPVTQLVAFPGKRATRPWWTENDFHLLTRSDGVQVRKHGDTGKWWCCFTSDHGLPELKDRYFDKLEDLLYTIDATKPLPFPGLRTGQIWLLDTTQVVYLATVDIQPFNRFRRNIGSLGFDQPNMLFGGAPTVYVDLLSELAGGGFFDGLTHHEAYLVHDPARPDLAPWSAKSWEAR